MYIRPSNLILTLCSVLIPLSGHALDTPAQSFQTETSHTQPMQSLALEQELNELIELYTFKPLISQKKSAIKRQNKAEKTRQMEAVNARIRFSGITDVRLFDLVEKNLQANYKLEKKRVDQQYAAWMVQMLAFSGNEKYRPLITKVRNWSIKGTVKMHANTSLSIIEKYGRWNKVISQNLEGLEVDELKLARLKNMLMAEDPELIRAGASIVYHYHLENIELTDFSERRLFEIYQQASTLGGKDEYAEASAWLCKVLGYSGNEKYRSTLKTILKNTDSPAIKRWARKSLTAMPRARRKARLKRSKTT